MRHALAEALGLGGEPANADGPTVDVRGAARLLHTSVGAIYERRRVGKLPRPVTARPLVWRVSDILAMKG